MEADPLGIIAWKLWSQLKGIIETKVECIVYVVTDLCYVFISGWWRVEYLSMQGLGDLQAKDI
jgi:hypothetical protein